jgi:signal transduction histidine kinase
VNNRLYDVALIGLSAVYCLAVLYADTTYWPGCTPTILLALPMIVLASLRKAPGFVVIVSALAIGVDAIDVADEHPDLSLWVSSLIMLVGISYLAIMMALQCQKADERSRRHAAKIRTFQDLRQPLTVIVGYTQMLRALSDPPDIVERSLARIDVAAREMKRLIDNLLRGKTHRRPEWRPDDARGAAGDRLNRVQ